MDYALKTTAQLSTTIADLDDKNTGLSFLFYSLVQGNTLDYKGESSSTVKRLVGSRLFPLVPMARYKKEGDTKSIFQYRMSGSDKIASELVEAGKRSVTELLGVSLVDTTNAYYPEFCSIVEAYIDAEKAAEKVANTAIKAEKDAEKVATEATEKAEKTAIAQAEAVKQTACNACLAENPDSMTTEDWLTRLAKLEKKQQAMTLLIEIGENDVAELLAESINIEVAFLKLQA